MPGGRRGLLACGAALLLSAAPLAAPRPAAAQEAGARVRVTAPIAPGRSRFVGTVAGADAAAVTLRLDAEGREALGRDTVVIPRGLIERVEVSLGRGRGSRGRTALTGAVAGAAAGMIVGLVAGTGKDENGGPRNPWETAAWTVPAGALAGAGVGYAVGQGEHEVWQPLRFDPRAAQARGRHELRMAIRVP